MFSPQSQSRVNMARKLTPGSCIASPSSSMTSPTIDPFRVSVTPVDAEQWLEAGILIVPLGRNLDDDIVVGAAVASDKGECRIAAANLAVDGINYAAACSMNRMELNRIKSVAHASPPRS